MENIKREDFYLKNNDGTFNTIRVFPKTNNKGQFTVKFENRKDLGEGVTALNIQTGWIPVEHYKQFIADLSKNKNLSKRESY